MKKMTKIFLTSGVTLVLGTGAVLSYLQAQRPQVAVSDLTLANLEAMAKFIDPDMDMDPDNPDAKGCDAYNSCNGVDITCHGNFTCESGQNGNVKYVMCDGFNFVTCRI